MIGQDKTMTFKPAWTNLTSRALIAALVLAALRAAMAAQAPAVEPVELVRRTVQNEIKTSDDGPKYLFRQRKETPHGSTMKLMVETREAMAGIVVAINDQPLTPEQRHGEYFRVARFIKDPEELKKKQRQEKEASERTTQIIKALPDAFLYEYDGVEPGKPGLGKLGDELVRLKFRPDPRYDPPSRVEQVLTGMRGYLLIDPVKGRIARIDGTLEKDVGFGWGILGHLDRGGHFLVEQGEIGGNDWEITRMDLAFTGKILLFKGINIKSVEVYSDFRPVPPDLTFAQGVELLKKQPGSWAENQQNKNVQQSR
jgi:hypothetical protein